MAMTMASEASLAPCWSCVVISPRCWRARRPAATRRCRGTATTVVPGRAAADLRRPLPRRRRAGLVRVRLPSAAAAAWRSAAHGFEHRRGVRTTRRPTPSARRPLPRVLRHQRQRGRTGRRLRGHGPAHAQERRVPQRGLLPGRAARSASATTARWSPGAVVKRPGRRAHPDRRARPGARRRDGLLDRRGGAVDRARRRAGDGESRMLEPVRVHRRARAVHRRARDDRGRLARTCGWSRRRRAAVRLPRPLVAPHRR